MSDLHALAITARSTIVDHTTPSGEVIRWRVRALSPRELGSIVGPAALLAAAVRPEVSPDEEEAIAQAQRERQGENAARLVDLAERVTCMAVEAVLGGDGEGWQTVHIVAEFTDEDADAGRLHISCLPASVQGQILMHALGRAKEAQARVATFRNPGVDGSAVGGGQAVERDAE